MNDPTKAHAPTGGQGETSWRRWVLYVAIALLVVIALQNSQTVRVKVLFIDGSAPLILALLIAALLGAVIGYALPILRRHRREERRRDGD
ncbi:MAG: lipopolysaccharide assembly protein LapA domain-containing protein [Solirubrobacterales bacterium]